MALRTTPRLILLFAVALLCACATTPKVPNARNNYEAGQTALKSQKYEEAIEYFKKVKESYSSPELSAQAELGIADAYFENKGYIEAAAAYEEFRKLHPTHPKVPYALYRLGMCNYREVTGIDTDQTPVKNAVATFEGFLASYPTSEYAAEVKEKLEDCRNKQLAYEVYVGNFYLRTKKYDSAIKRLTEALAKFPGRAHDATLLRLGEAYLRSGEKVRGTETLERMLKEYPQSPLVTEARKELGK
ncbi:outer membrane protein assembly factor BamD [Geomonas sp. RF6]|uniref:outer membrane protein assembly factor BamD n=1 Tax=Geomonas sp. RF6 TaxID=2897342 RepID=UPI001E406F52|nr:outer membrane protein assembly factor BamD [Geomonas sp. RF6]UFS71649.1 outer membrane protein assembly factor BamD [Geomonas sp. RF6]